MLDKRIGGEDPDQTGVFEDQGASLSNTGDEAADLGSEKYITTALTRNSNVIAVTSKPNFSTIRKPANTTKICLLPPDMNTSA